LYRAHYASFCITLYHNEKKKTRVDNDTKTTESYYDVLKFTVKAVYFTVFFNR